MHAKYLLKILLFVAVMVLLYSPKAEAKVSPDSCPEGWVCVTGSPIGSGSGGGSGGGGGGGGGPRNPTDMTPGTGDPGGTDVAANRFTPACPREKLLMDAVASAAREGNPINSSIFGSLAQTYQGLSSIVEDFTDSLSGGVKDPAYQDPVWRKYKAILEGKDNGNPFLIEIHYWWNSQTYKVEQEKLKTTTAQGCAGQATSNG